MATVSGSWPPAGPPPGQQPAPGSAQFMGQQPASQVYTSPQAQPPTAAAGYQWTSPPAGQPPQAVAVGQTPPGAYGAYVPVSATQQAPAVAAPVRQYGEFPASKCRKVDNKAMIRNRYNQIPHHKNQCSRKLLRLYRTIGQTESESLPDRTNFYLTEKN